MICNNISKFFCSVSDKIYQTLPSPENLKTKKKMYPVRSAYDHFEQKFTYRHHEFFDENVPEEDTEEYTETEVFHFLILGDQNAGKSTFLHTFSNYNAKNFTQLQSFLPTVTANFSNVCYWDGGGSSGVWGGGRSGGSTGSTGSNDVNTTMSTAFDSEESRKRKKLVEQKTDVEITSESHTKVFRKLEQDSLVSQLGGDDDVDETKKPCMVFCHEVGKSHAFLEDGHDTDANDIDAYIKGKIIDETPYIDTDLGKALLTVTAESFSFFCEEFGLFGTGNVNDSEDLNDTTGRNFIPKLKDETRFVVISLHEMGGDHLDRMMELYNKSEYDPKNKTQQQNSVDMSKNPLIEESLLQSIKIIKNANKIIYFVNSETVETVDAPDASSRTTTSLLEKRIKFLNDILTDDTDIMFYCSRLDKYFSTTTVKDSEEQGVEALEGLSLDDNPTAAAAAEENDDGIMTESKNGSIFTDIPTLEPFVEEYGDRWFKEKHEIEKLEKNWKFQQIKKGIERIFDGSINSNEAVSIETGAHGATQQAMNLTKLKLKSTYATRNINADGSVAVCSILIMLIRLLLSSSKRSSSLSVPVSDSIWNFGENLNTADLPSKKNKFDEFLHYVFLCNRHYRSTVVESDNLNDDEEDKGVVIYLAEDHFRNFLEDVVTVSPHTISAFDSGCEKLRKLNIVHAYGDAERYSEKFMSDSYLQSGLGEETNVVSKLSSFLKQELGCVNALQIRSKLGQRIDKIESEQQNQDEKTFYAMPLYSPLFLLVSSEMIVRNIAEAIDGDDYGRSIGDSKRPAGSATRCSGARSAAANNSTPVNTRPLIESEQLKNHLVKMEPEIWRLMKQTRNLAYLNDLVCIWKLTGQVV